MPMGLACCGIELMAVGASRFDIARFGAEVMRFLAPARPTDDRRRTCVYKMAGRGQAGVDQMPNPKCVSRWGCASTGGMYRSYAVVQVWTIFARRRVYLRVPAAAEALLEGLMAIQAQDCAGKSGREHEQTRQTRTMVAG